jgi:hypothetical protein
VDLGFSGYIPNGCHQCFSLPILGVQWVYSNDCTILIIDATDCIVNH